MASDGGPLVYKSQLSYGAYGARICTPVSCVVGINFVLDLQKHGLTALFPPSRIETIMSNSHDLYERHFSSHAQNLMVDDIRYLFPASVSCLEGAGLLFAEKEEVGVVDSHLVLSSLSRLIETLHQHASAEHKVALVVTCMDHTNCYLLEGGCVYLFEPLICSIRNVTSCWRSSLTRTSSSSHPTEYSALMLFHIKDSTFFKKVFCFQCDEVSPHLVSPPLPSVLSVP